MRKIHQKLLLLVNKLARNVVSRIDLRDLP
jgi:hypothetical protein